MSYDGDELAARMRDDADSDWPYRVAGKMDSLPLVSEEEIGRFGQRAGSVLEELTATETAALKAASHGMSSAETGVLVGASENNVRLRWRQAQRKLRAKNTTHACCEAIRQGLIP